MATSSELQRALALRKENPNMTTRDAVAQVRKDSFGTSQEFIAQQQAKRAKAPDTTLNSSTVVAPDSVPATVPNVSETPAITPTAPSSPSAPSAPAVPDMTLKSPVTQPVVEKPKVETPTFMTDVQRRKELGQVDQQASKDQMLANVGIMAKEDQSILTDRAKFEAKTGYAGKPQEEKVILDQYFQANKPKTSQELRNQIKSGVAITDPSILNSTAYRRAKFEQDRFSKYNSMNSEQLYTELKAGNIPPAVQNELNQNPNFAEAKRKEAQATQIANTNNSMKAFMGQTTEEVDPLTRIADTLTAIYSTGDQTGSTADAFRQYISQNPEITQPTAEYNQKLAQKKELERARESLVSDLKKKYAGEPLSTIMVMAANQSEPLNNQINTLNDALNLLASDIKYKTDFATTEFGFYQKDQEAKAAKAAKLQEVLGNLAVSQYKTAQDQAFEMKKMDIQQKYQADRDTQNYIQDLKKLGVQNVYDMQKLGANQEFQKELLALNQKYENSRSVRDFNNEITKLGYQFGLQQEAKNLDLKNTMALEDYKASLDPDKAEKWDAIRQKATENSSLADLYGKNVGTYEGNRGYDLAGKLGDAIVAPPGARVIEVRSLNDDGTVSMVKEGQGAQSTKDVGYGNSVVLQLPDGKFMRLSHLKSIDVPIGSELAGGQMVGTRGNTGNVRGANGEILTPEQKAAGRGAHVDVEIATDASFKGNSLLSQAQQLEYLKSVKPFGKTVTTELTDTDIQTFNNPTFKPADIKNADVKAKYDQYVKEASKLKTDKNASIEDILRFSAGGKELGAEEAKSLSKYDQALGQISGLQKSITEVDTGPIIGRLRSMNPYDTPIQTLKAQLNALIPNLARGVYGEVGVLTDQDIANYAKTIPNLTSTEDTNKAVLAMTLDTIAGGYKKQLRTLAASGRDVSGFASLYDEIKSQADYLKSQLGIEGQSQGLNLGANNFDTYLQSIGY